MYKDPQTSSPTPNAAIPTKGPGPSLDAYWMPFTANRQFKQAPRMFAKAAGMHYWTPDGRQVLDGCSGLWCVNAGHGRPRIVKAIAEQAAEMDYAPPFNAGHPKAFELAERLVALAPQGIDKVFYATSGSEAVESALKIAIAYHRVRGEGTRTRLIGRERGYHGVNFGGTSVGGIGPNRKAFGPLMGGVDHLRHTHDLARNAFSRGVPEHGAELADDLERLVVLHDASTIAAVIVEPVAGSTGVLLPFGATRFNVTPDMMTVAKGITNGCVPMGAVMLKSHIADAFMNGPEHVPEFLHGYTYSAHPLACAAGLATLDTYAEEGLFKRAAELEPVLADALHSLRELPNVIDLRNIGLVGAVELAPRPGEPGKRGFEALLACWDRGLHVRTTGDTIALAPALIAETGHIEQMAGILTEVLKKMR